jgi:hypothetical protein
LPAASGSATGGLSAGGNSSQAGSSAGPGGAGFTSGSGGGGQAGDRLGGAGEAGTAGTPTFPERPLCGGSVVPSNAAWCVGIEYIVLSVGALQDASGDGRVAPGEDASIVITIENQTAELHNYPCIGLLADNPDVTILGGEAHDNPAWDFFGIAPGQTLEVKMRFQVGASVVSGTTVHFVTWLDVLKAGCTNGNELEFELDVF